MGREDRSIVLIVTAAAVVALALFLMVGEMDPAALAPGLVGEISSSL